MQRIFLINLLWQKALSCQAFPAKKKISDKKYDIFSIIFWSSQPTSGIASGILKTKHRTTAGRSPPRNALFSRSTAPLAAKCSAAPEAAAKHKDRLPNVSFSRRSSVAPAGVEPTMGESKSPALPLGDGAPVRISIVEFLSFVKQKRFAVSVQSVLPHFYHVFTVSLS